MDRERRAADEDRLVEAVELDEADDRRAKADDDGADVGNEVGDAGGDAPDGGVVQAERMEGEAAQYIERLGLNVSSCFAEGFGFSSSFFACGAASPLRAPPVICG